MIGLLGAALATNAPAAVSNLLVQTTGVSVHIPDQNSPVEKEYQQLMDADAEAQADVDRMIHENEDFAAKGAGVPREQLRQRILDRFKPVRLAYEDFLQRHPEHVNARIAYASFLGDTKDEESAQEQLQKALALDTNNPAIYNNLANIEGHIGSVKKAFAYYERAIKLNPLEPVYYHNFATTVYLFRTDAKEYYGIDEQEVFAKAFKLYSNSMRLDPQNFPLASDVAQGYYGLKPLPTDEALKAWTNALSIAHDEVEREGVYIHFARLNILAGRFDTARTHLAAITNVMYADLKNRLEHNLAQREKMATNPATTSVQPAGEQEAKQAAEP